MLGIMSASRRTGIAASVNKKSRERSRDLLSKILSRDEFDELGTFLKKFQQPLPKTHRARKNKEGRKTPG